MIQRVRDWNVYVYIDNETGSVDYDRYITLSGDDAYLKDVSDLKPTEQAAFRATARVCEGMIRPKKHVINKHSSDGKGM